MQKNYIHYLFILIVCWFAFFVNNGSVYEDIMESRNLVTAHEMIEYDNWLVPTMNRGTAFGETASSDVGSRGNRVFATG